MSAANFENSECCALCRKSHLTLQLQALQVQGEQQSKTVKLAGSHGEKRHGAKHCVSAPGSEAQNGENGASQQRLSGMSSFLERAQRREEEAEKRRKEALVSLGVGKGPRRRALSGSEQSLHLIILYLCICMCPWLL